MGQRNFIGVRKALRGYDENSGKYQVFGSNGPIGWTSETLVPGPGAILGRKGAYRGVHYSPKPFFVIDTAYYVVPKNEFDMRWLYYAIGHYRLGEIDDGSPIPSTTRSAVYMVGLDVPPIGEQRIIAEILGTLDDKIELNRRMNETLEAMARALFKSWFVDFDPVRAKGEGRDPGLPTSIADLFPISFDEAALGDIPTGWEVVGLDKIARFLNGLALQKFPPTNDHWLPVIKIAQLRAGNVIGQIGQVRTLITTTLLTMAMSCSHGLVR
jgi:type I restriction enzyme, S subunit